MTREETEYLQESIELAVTTNKQVYFPENDSSIPLRYAYHKLYLDNIYWKDDRGEIYSVWFEIRHHKSEMCPGLYVAGTYTPNKFSSGNLAMIRKEHRFFPKDQTDTEYIESIPELKEKILETANTSTSECIPESKINWE